MNKNENIIVWANWLRAIAILPVILVHSTGELVVSNNLSISWHFANIIIASSRICIPVFLMLTGSFLLSKQKDIKTKPFLQKRLTRVVYPAIFWGIAYAIYNIFTSHQAGISISAKFIADSLIHDIKNGPSFQYWYIYMLIGVYLAIPLLNKWIKIINEKDILYFVGLWFIGYCLDVFDLGFINSIFDPFIGMIGFVVFGYYLFNKDLSKYKNISVYSLIGCIGSCLIVSAIAYFLNRNGGPLDQTAYGNTFPFVITAGIFMFICFKYSKVTSKPNKVINVLSKYSYAIYLNHMLILNILKQLGLDHSFSHPLISMPLIWVISLSLCILSAYLLSKIKFLKPLVGI